MEPSMELDKAELLGPARNARLSSCLIIDPSMALLLHATWECSRLVASSHLVLTSPIDPHQRLVITMQGGQGNDGRLVPETLLAHCASWMNRVYQIVPTKKKKRKRKIPIIIWLCYQWYFNKLHSRCCGDCLKCVLFIGSTLSKWIS